MRFREDTAEELAKARIAVKEWRDRNPAGSYEQLVAALGRSFHKDYAPVLRAVLSLSTSIAHQVTGIITGAAGAVR